MMFFNRKKRCIAVLLIAGLLFSKNYLPACAEESAEEDTCEYVQGEILVLYDEGIRLSETVEEISGEEQKIEILSDSADETIALVELPDDMTVDEAVKEYEKEAGVLAATPNYILELNEEESVNDPDLAKQSYLSEVYAEEAWDYYSHVAHEKVRVAVLDTGADFNHPELKNVINCDISGEILDKNGAMGPLQGDDYINGQYSSEGTGHGTHVCGILAAEANNLQGIAGVGSCRDNSAIELMVVDIFSNVKTTNMAYLICGMEYAAEKGAKVINLSLGVEKSKIDDTVLKEECDRLKEKNITLVCAAGNDGMCDDGEIQEVPCDYDSTIGVIATNANQQIASFSNYGTKKDIAAPGVSIYSTMNNFGYGTKSGTSMATPIVSSAVSMMYSIKPDITTEEVKTILKNTAINIQVSDMPEMGIVNCEDALKAVGGRTRLPFSDVFLNDWYYDYVAFVYDKGIMTGVSISDSQAGSVEIDEVRFLPQENIVRAQFATIIYRIAGSTSTDYIPLFPDVEENDWYAESVTWAADFGVITGYTDTGCFGPNDPITREQLATMLYRYAKIKGLDTGIIDYAKFSRFADKESVSGFAKEALAWAVSTGIIEGDNGLLNPQGNANRAECATMIERFVTDIVG